MVNPGSEIATTDLANLNKLIRSACVLTFIVVSLGALVRTTGSGLACPDWPLCFGQLVPVFNVQVFIEWFHRLMAGLLVVYLLFIALRVVRSRPLRKLFAAPLTLAVIILAVQVTLGGLTVLHLLQPKTVALHLVNAMLLYGVLLWLNDKSQKENPVHANDQEKRILRQIRRLMYFFVALVFGQIALGGTISSNSAGLICQGLLTCADQWLPLSSYLLTVNMLHRYIAAGLLVLGVLLAFLAHRADLPRPIKWKILLLPLLVGIQIALGILNIALQLPAWVATIHLANAVLIYTLGLTTLLRLVNIPNPEREAAESATVAEKGMVGI